jgi:hypothetical protein
MKSRKRLFSISEDWWNRRSRHPIWPEYPLNLRQAHFKLSRKTMEV